MKYYELNKSTNSEEIGIYPQAGLNLNHNKHDLRSPTKLKPLNLPSFKPNFEDLEIDRKAKFTDYISCGLSAYGMLLSQKAYKILCDFKIDNHVVYKLNIKNSERVYYWFHFGPTQVLKTINYSKSEFKIDEFGFEKERITLSNYSEYESKKKELNNMSVIKAISLNLNVKPKNDLFIIPFLDGKIYVSERIADQTCYRCVRSISRNRYIPSSEIVFRSTQKIVCNSSSPYKFSN